DKVTAITLDPKNWKTAYATAGQKVFATTDGGTTWAEITGPNTGTGALPSQNLTGAVLIPIDQPDLHFQPTTGPAFDVSLRGAKTVEDLQNFIGTASAVAPTVTFSGGGGTGATGNAIMGPGGKVIGVTITNPGMNYTSDPTVTFGHAPAGGTDAPT